VLSYLIFLFLIPTNRLFSPSSSWFFDDEDFFNFNNSKNLPKLDLSETDKKLFVSVDLPNFDKKDIVLKVQDNKLILKGAKKEEKTDDKKYYLKERFSSEFHREIMLPKDIDPKTVKANIKNGVLTVSMDKKEKSAEIEISVD
jgi:HSP20 family protein